MPIIDLLITTPLDEEWNYVKTELLPTTARESRESGRSDGMWFHLWTAEWRGDLTGGDYLLAGAPIANKTSGQSYTAAYATRALGIWRPAYVCLLGIAGSFAPDQLRLGDVVIPERIYGGEFGDAVENAEGSFNLYYRHTQERTDRALFDAARAFRNSTNDYSAWQDECHRAGLQLLGEELQRPPELHFGLTASGNFVVKSPEFARELQQQLDPKVRSVEMEAVGLFRAIHLAQGGPVGGLIIRGISDYADADKAALEARSNDGWRQYAAGNSARLLKYLLKRGLGEPVSNPVELDLTTQQAPDYLAAGHGYALTIPRLISRDGPTPSFTLSMQCFAGARPTGLTDVTCTLRNPSGSLIIPAVRLRDESTQYVVPRNENPIAVSLGLRLPAGVDRILFQLRDEFGRTRDAEWRSGGSSGPGDSQHGSPDFPPRRNLVGPNANPGAPLQPTAAKQRSRKQSGAGRPDPARLRPCPTVERLAAHLMKAADGELSLIIVCVRAENHLSGMHNKFQRVAQLIEWIRLDESQRLRDVYDAALRYSESFAASVNAEEQPDR